MAAWGEKCRGDAVWQPYSQKNTKSMGVGYESEVPLFTIQKFKSAEYEEDFSLKIEGRADGIFTDGDLTVIDEIKGVYLPVQDLEKPLFIHQAQAMCYAYIVAENENLDERVAYLLSHGDRAGGAVSGDIFHELRLCSGFGI